MNIQGGFYIYLHDDHTVGTGNSEADLVCKHQHLLLRNAILIVVGETGVLKVKTNVFVSFSCPSFLTLKRFTAVIFGWLVGWLFWV